MIAPSILNRLHLLFRGKSSAAIFDPQGQLVFSQADRPEDFGVLIASTQTMTKYFQLKPLDLAFMNDPYSGGSHLHHYFVTCAFSLKSGRSQAACFHFTKKLSFKPRLCDSSHIDEEGLRVPPTPIGSLNSLDLEILKAIGSHPKAPAKFAEVISNELSQLTNEVRSLSQIFEDFLQSPIQTFSKNFYQEVKLGVENLFDDLPDSSTEVLRPVGLNSAVHLKLHSNSKNLTFDFTGTEKSDEIGMTDAACLGVCVSTFLKWQKQPMVATQALLDRIILVAPKKSFVNVAHPQATYLGMTDGVAYLQHCLLHALESLDRNQPASAMSGYSQCSFEINFGDQVFFDHVLPGAGGSQNKIGRNGQSPWELHNLQPSVEEIEAQFPMLVRSIALRKNSGGSGISPGGSGQAKTFELLKPAKFTWLASQLTSKISGSEGGRPGSPPEIHILKPGQKKEVLPLRGSLQLEAGTIISLQSGGGGGWGFEAPAEEK